MKTYNAFGRTLLLERLSHFFSFEKFPIKQVPVCVKLPNLPLECWHPRTLSKISSKIGRPIKCDQDTHLKKRIDYARILGAVDPLIEPVCTVTILLPNGHTHAQKVLFEQVPKLCSACNRFGHYTNRCGSHFPEDKILHSRPELCMDDRTHRSPFQHSTNSRDDAQPMAHNNPLTDKPEPSNIAAGSFKQEDRDKG